MAILFKIEKIHRALAHIGSPKIDPAREDQGPDALGGPANLSGLDPGRGFAIRCKPLSAKRSFDGCHAGLEPPRV